MQKPQLLYLNNNKATLTHVDQHKKHCVKCEISRGVESETSLRSIQKQPGHSVDLRLPLCSGSSYKEVNMGNTILTKH